MKNMFKNAGKMVLFTCLSLMLLTACGQKSKLKLAIAAANKQCPMDMGASGEISSITFDGSDVVYVLLMNESFLNIDALKENPDAMKSAVTVMFGNPQGSIKEMLDLVVGTDSGIKFIYKGKTSGNEVECYLTTQDLKDILNGVKSIKRMLARRLLSVFWKIENVTNMTENNVLYTYRK